MSMGAKGEENRKHIVSVANTLFYHRGYNQTSFTDIAEASEIPRGNFYYYFKTKDEILQAVIDSRLQKLSSMLASWEQEIESPLQRLKRYVQILRNVQSEAVDYGCPMGSLNTELAKAQRGLQKQAKGMFDVVRKWLERQFTALGHTSDAGMLAMQLLSRTQGIAVITQAYRDKKFLQSEAQAIDAWLDELARKSLSI